ncbi:MAG: hypothetical protein QOI28_4458 [Mycobacterium sp.]|jgi:hypothetical protein|nr:hypothetical protein [Mycobacterium sp.]
MHCVRFGSRCRRQKRGDDRLVNLGGRADHSSRSRVPTIRHDDTAQLPRSARTGSQAVGNMSMSKIAVGRYSEQHDPIEIAGRAGNWLRDSAPAPVRCRPSPRGRYVAITRDAGVALVVIRWWPWLESPVRHG